MYKALKLENGSLYRGSIPFFLMNKNKKTIYISSSNKNIRDYSYSLKELSKKRVISIENYDYTQEEIRAKNYELIENFSNKTKENSSLIVFLSLDSLFRNYFVDVTLLEFHKNKDYKLYDIKKELIKMSYEENYLVEKAGEFAIRGDILDIYPITEENPIRIEFWDNNIEDIRIFDVESQRSIEKIKEFKVFSNNNKNTKYDFIEFLEYFQEKNIDIYMENIEILNYKLEEYILNNRDEEGTLRNKYNFILKNSINIETKRFDMEDTDKFRNLDYVKELSKKINLTIYTEEKKRYSEIFENLKVRIEKFPHYEGFKIEDNLILTDRELKGIKVKRDESRKNTLKLSNISQIRNGDYVIHENYGVGIFLGIEVIDNLDYMAIKYADEDKLYVPIDGINKIEKFVYEPGLVPEIFKLGRKGFKKKRDRLRENIEKFAKELIEIQAKRSNIIGHKYSLDTVWQEEFEEGFPYNETRDQLRAIQDVKKDMESYKVMDRIVCGDVGYGKTEVALRAAFKACMDGKQVAIIAPTTVLANQHYERFVERFKNFPIEIRIISRLESKKEQNEIINLLSNGSVDIVVGTHRLLSNDISFKDLGLVIIDEEQKFGVKAKEKLKKLRLNVDMLTLTATPIPRTLNLALLGIRDISIIETPPKNRLPVETNFIKGNNKEIKDAILKEIGREGQVFYLYNSVNTMEHKFKRLCEILPKSVKLDYIHGRMPSNEIKRKINNFDNGVFDILLTTTIIENGIDIENANTIIIEGMTRLGLAQIYQLRGRVGRGGKKAYCYLVLDEDIKLNKKSKMRKDSLIELGDFGAGFQLSLEDMKIRGAGELLGEKQHGAIETFGYDLYLKMLDEEIKRHKNIEVNNDEIYIKLNINAHIPKEYIKEEEKIVVYKRMLNLMSIDELDELKLEIEDRFGKLPLELKNLFYYNKIKLLAKSLGIKEIIEKNKKYIIKVNENKFEIDKVNVLILKGEISYLSKEKALLLEGDLEKFLLKLIEGKD